MEYVAIDFQTANRWHKSACSVALVTVKDGKIIDTFYSLIRPGILHFDKENTALHGITKEMVKDAPYFDELWPLIKEKINGKTLVAHYATWTCWRKSWQATSLRSQAVPCFARACFRKQCSRRCLIIACRTLPIK